MFNSVVLFKCYSSFDIFQKVMFCLALYTEEVTLQRFIIIKCKKNILFIGCKEFEYLIFHGSSKMAAIDAKIDWLDR